MKNKIIGYVVEGKGGTMGLVLKGIDGAPKTGLLMYASSATLFKSRKVAAAARKRTIKFMEARGYDWDVRGIRKVVLGEVYGG